VSDRYKLCFLFFFFFCGSNTQSKQRLYFTKKNLENISKEYSCCSNFFNIHFFLFFILGITGLVFQTYSHQHSAGSQPRTCYPFGNVGNVHLHEHQNNQLARSRNSSVLRAMGTLLSAMGTLLSA